MSVVSIRLNEEEEKAYKTYAQLMGRPLSELFKKALAEEIEDAIDYEIGCRAIEERKEGDKRYTIHEVADELGITL